MDVEEGEMGDDEAPTTWWVFRSSGFLVYKDNTLMTYQVPEWEHRQGGRKSCLWFSLICNFHVYYWNL